MCEVESHTTDIYEYLPQDLSLEISICVIQELVDFLSILKTINNWPNVQNDNFEYRTLKDRFEETVFHYEKTDNSLCPENFSTVLALGVKLLEELKQEGAYSKFSGIIDTLQKMKSDEQILLKEAAKKEESVKQLQAIFDSERAVYVNKIINCMAETGKIKDEIENYHIESGIKINYIISMQKSKLEMNDTLFFDLIEENVRKIKFFNVKIGQDIRVHKEVETFIGMFIKDLEDKIEEWRNRYNEKLNEMNIKLAALQAKQNKQLEIIANFKDLFAKRQKEIVDYKQHKVEQERLRLEKEKRDKAATIIQAWWKGTMVRKGFGKFRKKKEKKGKKKSSEKKEKKK